MRRHFRLTDATSCAGRLPRIGGLATAKRTALTLAVPAFLLAPAGASAVTIAFEAGERSAVVRGSPAAGFILLTGLLGLGLANRGRSARRGSVSNGGFSMAKLLASATTGLAFLLIPAAVSAVTIFGTFEGTVTSVPAALISLDGFFIRPGDAISGSFQYESDQPGSPVSPDQTDYDAVVEIDVGGFIADLSTNMLGIIDADSGDAFQFQGNATGSPMLGGLPLENFIVFIRDSTGMVFSDTSLPTSLLFGDFDSSGVILGFTGSNDVEGGAVLGTLTAFTLSVPEPTAGILFLTGLLGLGVAGRRRSVRRLPPRLEGSPW